MKEITLRAYRSEDLPELLRLFHETVREVCAGEYTREQRDAWAPPPEQLDTGPGIGACGPMWRWWLRRREESPVLQTWPHRIIWTAFTWGRTSSAGAWLLLWRRRWKRRRFGLGAEAIRVHASLTAKPFFEKRGYRVEREQTVRCRGVEMTNFAMKKIGPG